jgi:abortive infection bacteriophage resistance protein
MTVPFSKPALDYAAQLRLLESRGLTVTDRSFALHTLQHLNYYRLSAYRFPLTVMGNPDQFLPGVTFADLWTLYDFDQMLRRLVMDASKRVEVSIRAHWSYVLGHKYGPFCYEDSALFEDGESHLGSLGKLYGELARSKEDFVKHFRQKYGLNRPPIWAVSEVFSLGQLSHFYKNLRLPADRNAIAEPFGIDEKVMASFLHHLTIVRNTAAHHGRLWNRLLVLKFILPQRPAALYTNFHADPATAKRIYNTLTMLLHLLSAIEPGCPVGPLLHRTIDSLDVRYHPHMGFPPDWRSRPLWSALAPRTA